MSSGITCFNFGGSCAIRLMVTLYSLREHYKGGVTVYLAEDDAFNELLEEDVKKLANIRWYDYGKLAKRNLKSVLKPRLFRDSVYTNTLMIDGDLLFQKDPGALFKYIDDKGFLVTQFSSWNCDGGRMRGRVKRCWEWLSEKDKEVLLSKHPAINIGVMGWNSGHTQVLEDWEDMTMKLAGKHIADEVACQCVYHRHSHYVASETWNSSCMYGLVEPKSAAILHYHGNKHTNIERASSRRWLAYLVRLIDKDLIEYIDTYIDWGKDRALKGALKNDPNLFKKVRKWPEYKELA